MARWSKRCKYYFKFMVFKFLWFSKTQYILKLFRFGEINKKPTCYKKTKYFVSVCVCVCVAVCLSVSLHYKVVSFLNEIMVWSSRMFQISSLLLGCAIYQALLLVYLPLSVDGAEHQTVSTTFLLFYISISNYFTL